MRVASIRVPAAAAAAAEACRQHHRAPMRCSAAAAAALLLSVLLLLSGHQASAQFAGDDMPQTTLIVEYEPEAVQAAVQQSGVTAATAAVAAAEAFNAAGDRGASASRRAEIAAVATAAAMTTPAVSSLTFDMYRDASASGIEVTGVTNFATVMQGAAIRTASSGSASQLKSQLEANPKVKKVWYAGVRPLVKPVDLTDAELDVLEMMATIDPMAALGSAGQHIPTNAVDGNSNATGLTDMKAMAPELDGSGQLICVIDTGMSFVKNALYGECTGINTPKGKCKVVAGYDFVGDAFTGLQTGPSAVRGGTPSDCMGHGTMVASVAGTSNGVATGASLGSYRVFGCSGYATDDILIEAIDRAVRDGCDVINLSLATGSGYADTSVFKPVMTNAIKKGSIVVKAAGNSGRDGPFNADVATAAGSITLASVGSAVGEPVDSKVVMSRFSSIGPAPDLTLVPSVAAPGAFIQVRTMTNDVTYVSGTSFSSPYAAGLLAMWLQYKQNEAAAAGVKLDPATVSQEVALRGLVATAKGVKDPLKPAFLEPVARMGAGMIQAKAFLVNKARLEPMMVQLPSALTAPHTVSITVAWEGGPADRALPPTWDLHHAPSVSMTLNDGWYGTSAIRREYVAANVYFGDDTVVLDPRRGNVTFKVTFSLPRSLRAQPLLYSGLIELSSADPAVPSLVVPYQGFSQPMSRLRIPARVDPDMDLILSGSLANLQNALCYAPRSQPRFLNAILDAQVEVPGICSGGFAERANSTLEVSLGVLAASPECSLRVTVVPEVSMRTVRPILLDEVGEVIGHLAELDTSSGNSLSTAGEVWSTCLHFDGNFVDTRGRKQVLQVGQVYGLKTQLVGILPEADAALGRDPVVDEVDIRGRFKVVA